MEKTKLFGTGALQVSLVTLNTYLIATGNLWAVLVVSFSISFVWSFNVKRVAFGNLRDRITYSAGAAIGGAVGLLVGKLLEG